MKKVLVSGISAIAFGVIALISVPKESKADMQITPPCQCGANGGTREVFRKTVYDPPSNMVVETFLGCLTSAQIAALPPLPIIPGQGYVQSYRIGCGSVIGGPL